MNERYSTPDDEANVDVLLHHSAPPTPLSDAVDDATLRMMIHSAAPETSARARRPLPRFTALGTVALVVFGGAGVAAAATYPGWTSAFEEPDTVSRFTLPSGVSCEFRTIVRPNTGTPQEREAVTEFLKDADVLAVADIDAELARVMSREATRQGRSGADLRTEQTSEDRLYYDAVTGAINNAIWDHLEDTGVVDPVAGSDLSFASLSDCWDEIE